MSKEEKIKIVNQDTYGVGDNFMLSAVKIGKTTFIVLSCFTNDREFLDAMEKIIENRVNVS